MMRVPELVLRKCAFCEGDVTMVSNLFRSVGGRITTINDLGAVTNGSIILPDLPGLFVHPVERTYCVWNSHFFGSKTHRLDSYEGASFFESVLSDVRSENMNALVYYHVTEGDITESDLGWHRHIAVSTTGEIKVLCGGTVQSVRWCDYTIWCGTFKMILKLNQALVRPIKITKPTELPFPLSHVASECDRVGSSAYVTMGCLCLQMMILSGAVLPRDLIQGRANGKEDRSFKLNLWFRLYNFLFRWDWKDSIYHQRLKRDELYVHPVWAKYFHQQQVVHWHLMSESDLANERVHGFKLADESYQATRALRLRDECSSSDE
jgi:hypothetical protein